MKGEWVGDLGTEPPTTVAEAFQPRRRAADHGSLKHLLLENQCYHTISSTRDRRPVFANPECASLVLEAIDEIRKDRAHVLGWAVMPDHLHLVVVPIEPQQLPQVMQGIKGYSSWAINRNLGLKGPLWQQGYYDRMIRSEKHLFEAIQYVNMNPVVAGLAREPGDYRFASWDVEETDLERWYTAEAGKPRLRGVQSGPTQP